MALLTTRRFMAVVWATTLIAICSCLFFLFAFHKEVALTQAEKWGIPLPGSSPPPPPAPEPPKEEDKKPPHPDIERLPLFETNSTTTRRIAILESGGTHDEVTAALVHAFGGQKNVELALMLKHQRYRMEDIMGEFQLKSPVAKIVSSDVLPQVMEDDGERPHILISTTCLLDINVHPGTFRKILEDKKTHLMCLVHHADRWDQGDTVSLVRSFIEEGRADFVCLSPHTVDYLLDVTSHWDSNADIRARVIPPVFPVKLPEPAVDRDVSLAMQGDYSSGRRDYQHTFEQLGNITADMNAGNVESDAEKKIILHLIGHGTRPEVPAHLADNVKFDEGLSYPDFYKVLSEAFAILPAFASDTYLDRKASSTIPAALIAGAPMIANDEILKAYSYLPPEAVWISEPGEEEMDTVVRFMGDTDGYLERATKMRHARDRLLQSNRQQVGQWMDEIIPKD